MNEYNEGKDPDSGQWVPCAEGQDALSLMVGRKFARVERVDKGGDRVRFIDTAGNVWTIWHSQSCCETVRIEDINGYLGDLDGSVVWSAEEATSDAQRPGYGHATWTFYQIRAEGGDITIRWFGESNGYYSEKADVFVALPLKEAP